MDAIKFSKILSDGHITDLNKMKRKYPDDFGEFIAVLKSSFYESLPISDFGGQNLVYLKSAESLNINAIKLLYTAQSSAYGAKAIEEEILATNAIESIDFSRDSVRNILKGLAPKNDEEARIQGMKNGFEFISDKGNGITEDNIHKLYMMSIGDFLKGDDRLTDGELYRNGEVYVVGSKIEHSGLNAKKLPGYMTALTAFINADDDMNDLVKACIIHFCISYYHPYFDGNGRMARLLHMWFLIQKGYETTLFVPFSSHIEKGRKKYYSAFTLVEENAKLSGAVDVTPFILYFIENVYEKITHTEIKTDTFSEYKSAYESGKITLKEDELWKFVLSAYAGESFTTKQLEKDFGNAAYATVRAFAIKFEQLGLLAATKLSNKTVYRVK